MNGHDHALVGAVSFGVAIIVGASRWGMPSATSLTVGVVVAVGASLAPDIDEKHSVASQGAGLFGWAARKITGTFGGHRSLTHFPLLWLAALSALSALLMAGRVGQAGLGVVCGVFVGLGVPFLAGPKRRSRLGPLLDVVVVVVGYGTYWWVVSSGLVAGWWLFAALPVPWMSHMVADTPTPAGVPWFFPLSRRRFGFGLFHSGGSFETSVVSPLLTVAVAVVTWKLLTMGAYQVR